MKMYYWNRDNFESLAHLALLLRQTKELSCLAEYCELREKGLRKQALAAASRFLAESTSLTEERRLELAIYLLELHWDMPEAHQFLTQPLLNEFIFPVLRKAARPGNNAFRNLALLQARYCKGGEEQNALSLVLQHTPADSLVRQTLISILLNEADFAMHHLHESFFIGSEEYCGVALDKAATLLERQDSHEGFSFLRQEHGELSAKLEDWLEYKKTAQTVPFMDWSASIGRNYGWNLTVYYDA